MKFQDLDKKAKNWLKHFNNAVAGDYRGVGDIAEHVSDLNKLVSELETSRRALRRDLYARFMRLPLLDDNAVDSSDLIQPAAVPPSRSRSSSYTQSDYTASERPSTVEEYLDSLPAQKSILGLVQPLTEPIVGDTVIIWIQDHFYDEQRGRVIEKRSQDGRYLVEIETKRPHIRGHRTQPGARALVYVTAEDVKVIR